MKKSEITIEIFDTNQSVSLIGLRFMVYTLKRLFEKTNDERLNWDLNVSSWITILNRMNPDEQDKVMSLFGDFYEEVGGQQIEELKSIFLPYYNDLISEIQPSAIVALIGEFDGEIDDFVYNTDLLF